MRVYERKENEPCYGLTPFLTPFRRVNSED